MKISAIRIYQKELRYARGAYAWGRGNVITSSLSTIVVIDTDAGISGCGEFCPCGENYMQAHSQGTEAAMRIIAPVMLGEDPRQLGCIEHRLDFTIQGHEYTGTDTVHHARGTHTPQ